jgi:hypothetical protein
LVFRVTFRGEYARLPFRVTPRGLYNHWFCGAF